MQNSGEIVYGVCLPATGFSALFVVISLITVISILVSGFVCYQRQMQKVAEESAPKKVTAAMGAPTAQQVRGGIHVTYEFPFKSAYESPYDLVRFRFPIRYESAPILN
jgi:hypothetical protein